MSPQVWWFVSRSSGMIAWGLLTLSVCWGLFISTKAVAKASNPAWLLDLHRYLGGTALIFTAIHLVGLAADNYVTFGWAETFVPMASSWKAGPVAFGIVGFYLLLASVGAQADLKKIVTQPLWIVAGVVVIAVHALVLVAALRWMRAPSFFLGAASQASIGGYASAPVVAEIYQAGLAPVGLLLAVVGNVLGTYLGLAVGALLKWLAA